MEAINKWLWSESFWFPGNITWKDLKNVPQSDTYLPQAEDLNLSLPLGLILLLVRYICEFYILTPFGFWVGVKEKKVVKASPNPVLESFYTKNGIKKCDDQIQSIAKQTDLPVRQVEVWLRQRRKQDVPSDIKKFRECGWHFIFYMSSFVYGFVILWKKSWFWETKDCWRNWPLLHVSNDVYWYYLVELSFYWCLVFSMVTDHKRKDFAEMIVHHVATILLMYFSWLVNFVRIGTLVLLVHDASDFPMAAAKMAKYCGRMKLCEVFLVVFIIVWIVSRLITYPFRVLYSSTFEVYLFIEPFYAYYFFNGLLIVLQLLHIVWTIMIARIALTFQSGKVKDVRSDTSDIGSD